MKKTLSILPILLLWTTLLFAQKFTASVAKSTFGVGEQLEVDFSINADGTNFTAPDFGNNFQVLSGPNMSTSMESINGATSVNVTYSYILAPVKEGTFTISAAAIVVNGHTLLTNQLKIKVQGHAPANQQAPQQAAQQQQAPQDDSGNATAEEAKDISKQLFIRAVADKTSAYVGEQIIVSYKIYTRLNLAVTGVDKAPDLNGFWSQDIPNKTQATWAPETYKGLKYNVVTIKQTVIFPEHAGDLTIDPLALNFMVRIPVKGVFDNPFGNFQDVKYLAKSAPVTIHAIALPEAGKPANFTGAVGTFAVVNDVDKKELRANETLNYTYEIKGAGNLALITAPSINPPADFDKYDPKSNDNITVDLNGVSGTRQYSYLLIPRHEGSYTINPGNFSYFNPVAKRYVTVPTRAYTIKVDKGVAQANVPAFNSSDQQDIRTLGTDIRYIKTASIGLDKNGEGFYNSPLFYVLLLLGPALFGAALYYRSWNEQYNSDQVLVKSRQANKIAAKHLAEAQKQLTAGNKTAFFEAIAKGLFGYLSDKLNIPLADLHKENIADKLRVRLPDEKVIKQLDDTMNLCEMARFAPSSAVAQQEVFEKAKNIINEIEQKI